MRVAIEGDGKKYNNFRDVTIQPFTSQLIRFSTGYMAPAEYKINVEGLSGSDFHQQKTLEFQSKNMSIFVQSDKAIYKPGDLVRFRVLVLDMNMKPMPSQYPINVYVTVRVLGNLFSKEDDLISAYVGQVNCSFISSNQTSVKAINRKHWTQANALCAFYKICEIE